MTSGQKTALSILITVILFGAFTVFAFAGLFSAIDSRFYEGAKISQINKKLEAISTSYDEYIKTLDARFASGEAAYLKNPSVASFVESRPQESDVLKRGELTGTLRSETQGLVGIRIVDTANSIHYSTFRSDILRQDIAENMVAYKGYSEAITPSGNEEISIEALAAQDVENDSRVYFDGADGRIIFSYPFYDKYKVFRGTIIFYVSAADFGRVLIKKNLITVGTPLDFIADSSAHGYAFGIPSVAHEEFIAPILGAWKENKTEAQKLFAINPGNSSSSNYWIMISSLAGSNTYVSEIFNDEILVMPLSARILILVCTFITIFLIVFLILNLRRDDMTVIRERIRTLQLGVVEEYLKRKSDLDWETISGKREAVTKEIIASLGRRAKRHPKEVEELINRSWDELLAAMNFQPKQQSAAFSAENTEEIKAMLQEILSSGNIKVQAVGSAPVVSPVQTAKAAAPAENVEVVEELEEIEEVEELEEVEPLEEVEEVDELEEAEPLEEVESLEEVEEIEEVKEIEEIEPLEEVEPVEEVEPLEEIEELEEIIDAEEILSSTKKPEKALHSPDEIIDISEDASLDFFAVKKQGEEKKQKRGLLSLAVALREDSKTDSKILEIDKFKDIRENVETPKEDVDILNNFNIGHLDYKELDNTNEEEKQKGTYALEQKEAAQAMPLTNIENFMFTSFGEDSKNVQTLQSADNNVITQSSDGIFSISDTIATDGVLQDNSFKHLVDSVLGK